MIGLISGKIAGRRPGMDVEGVRPLGLTCIRADIRVPEGMRERRRGRFLERCVSQLRGMYVRRVIFSEGFPWRDFFLARGFAEAGCETLLASKAGEIAASAAAKRDRAVLCARRGGRLTETVCLRLGERFRYVVIDGPEDLRRALDRACAGLGLTPEVPRRDRVAEADAAVFLSPPVSPIYLPARCRTLTVAGGRELVMGGREIGAVSFLLPERLRFSLPFPKAPILSAALDAGRIAPGQVFVRIRDK